MGVYNGLMNMRIAISLARSPVERKPTDRLIPIFDRIQRSLVLATKGVTTATNGISKHKDARQRSVHSLPLKRGASVSSLVVARDLGAAGPSVPLTPDMQRTRGAPLI